MVIDFTTYAYPPNLAGEAFARMKNEGSLTAYADGTIHALKQNMAANKIDMAVVLPIAYEPLQVEPINEWACELRYDEKDIIPFGTVHSKTTNYKQIFRDLKYRKIKGIKIHPAYQGFSMEDENTLLILYAAAMEGFIIYIHMGQSFGTDDPGFSISYLKYLIKELNGAKIIASHMGGYNNWEQVEKELCGEELYFDTSLIAGKLDKALLRQIINKHGSSKILFGSAQPFGDPKEYFRFLKLLNLDKRVEGAIYYNNAAQLLGISGV